VFIELSKCFVEKLVVALGVSGVSLLFELSDGLEVRLQANNVQNRNVKVEDLAGVILNGM
jgi:hypothetical protein